MSDLTELTKTILFFRTNIRVSSLPSNRTFVHFQLLTKTLKLKLKSKSKFWLRTKTEFLIYYYKKLQIFRCLDLSLIFSELCNAVSFFLINENHTQLGELNIMNLLLLCGTHEEYEVFQKTFEFWFNISEEIYTNPKSEKLCTFFREYIYSLIECLCKHCQLDANYVMP